MSAAERWDEAEWLPVTCPTCGGDTDLLCGAGVTVAGRCHARVVRYDARTSRVRKLYCGAWVRARRIADGPVQAERIYRPRRARHGQEDA